ncbi:MAG TPA: ABC-2 transporter permease [Lachnospiraceae bacterium]|nr:ABC-2 transporter permease [Lachnospiraceae bacterium]
MRGLIYKEFTVFYKCIDKKLIAIAVGFTLLLLYTAGIYGGLMASVLFAITIGMQNIMSFTSDDKARWKKYQMAMPLSSFSVVASKYISVICTLGISLAGCILFNLLSGCIYGTFDAVVWEIAVFATIFIPLMWTGICLPLTYWFGVQSAQFMGMLIIVPLFYLIKYFEDGSGLSAMVGSLSSYLLLTGIVTLLLFCISLGISVIGYARRK